MLHAAIQSEKKCPGTCPTPVLSRCRRRNAYAGSVRGAELFDPGTAQRFLLVELKSRSLKYLYYNTSKHRRYLFQSFLYDATPDCRDQNRYRFKHWPRSRPVQQLDQHLLVNRRAFLHSEFYNVLWRAAEICETLMSCVWVDGRIRGLLQIYRSAGDPPFEPDDVRILEAIAGFVAHGMKRADLGDDAFVDDDNRALFVADPGGTIQHAGARAQQLLRMAFNPVVSHTAYRRGLDEPIPEVAQLCRTLAATARGEFGQPPPVLRLRTH